MPTSGEIQALAQQSRIENQYSSQIARLASANLQTGCIVDAVSDSIRQLPSSPPGSFVIYGDPQSGKTEMMICLTAALLDSGHSVIIHLMNDSVDLLKQNHKRFQKAGLAPAPRLATDLSTSPLRSGHPAILFCKKNGKDLQKLVDSLDTTIPITVIDDEADYATPNSKVNQNRQSRINDLVSQLLGNRGIYIGVTATPARLNLNNLFGNTTESWVHFRPHDAYTGQETFFPLNGQVGYRRVLLQGAGGANDAVEALGRFLVTVAHLNIEAGRKGQPEEDYSFLVHTSGKREDHTSDRQMIERAMHALEDRAGTEFENFVRYIHAAATRLYPNDDPDELIRYVIANASRHSFVVLNSNRDRKSAGDEPTSPTCPFTIIVGGNIVSRGVTFPNLLSMYFTRDVKTKIQQDTYIQRARMFGSRGDYLQHFELTIPDQLYGDWSRCFVLHRLALEAIKQNDMSPVWVGDSRISIVSSSSIDRATVDLNRGEMSFPIFDCPDLGMLDDIVARDPASVDTVRALAEVVGDSIPDYLISYLDTCVVISPNSLAIHTSASMHQYRDADVDKIARKKSLIGTPQLEQRRFPSAVHHLKIYHNGRGKARLFYKSQGGSQFVQNMR